MSVTVTDAENLTDTLPYEFFVEIPEQTWLDRLRGIVQQRQTAEAQRAQQQQEQREQQRVENERRLEQQARDRELEKWGLKPLDQPRSAQVVLASLMIAGLLSLLALPVQVPIATVLLRGGFALDMKFVMPSADEVGTEATWGRTMLAALATQGTMIAVGFVISLYTTVVANAALVAPLITGGLTAAQALVAQWGIQASMLVWILGLKKSRAIRVALYQIILGLLLAAIVGGFVVLLLNVT